MEKGSEAALNDIRKYEDILAKDSHSFCFAPLSDLYRRLGRLDEALDTALRGCELHPGYIGGYMALGRACFEKGLYAESRQALEKVVRVMPDNLLAHSLLDQIDVALSQAEGAAATEEFELEWGDGLQEESAGEAITDADEDDDVIELMDEVVEEDEEPPPQPYGYDDEPEVLTLEPAEPPANPLSTATIADLYFSQGFKEKALVIYRELLAADPDNIELRQRVESVSRSLAEEEQVDAEPLSAAALSAVGELPADEGHEGNVPAPEQPSVLETLEGWLANIRRLR